MGLDINRFAGNGVDEELICPICTGVLESPMQAPVCEHAFCLACIREWLTRGRSTCPVDRTEFTMSQLKPVPRILKNLLSRLEINCDNHVYGCPQIIKLDLLANHIKDCEYNPKKPVTCVQGCGVTVPKDEMKDHNCVRELRSIVKSHEQKLSEQAKFIADIKYQLAEQRRELSILSDFRPRPSISNGNGILSMSGGQLMPGVMGNEHHVHGNNALTMNTGGQAQRTLTSRLQENDAISTWCGSLPRAKVTRWGGMISTPDADLQAQIRRSLAESGCPDTTGGQLLDDLMANAHERRWPPGLLTLETRQMNRRQYEQYVCRRVPARQAVVVMACDNSHMSDDMIIEPGLVMIFAHGIE